MPALPPYIPSQEAKFALWLDNFATLVSGDPLSYGLTLGDGVTIAALNASWIAAYGPVTSPSTKTAAAVAAKNAARVSVTAQIRVFAQDIAKNPGVSPESKVAVGLNPGTSMPAPITAPATNPVLTLQSLGNLSAILRYRDSAASVSVKAKPFGVTQCRIYGAASATPPSDPSAMLQIAAPTKSPFVLALANADIGKTMYCVARWAIRTGGVSPMSPMMSFTVPGAG